MSGQMITVCQICWNMTSHKTNPTLTTIDKVKKDKLEKQICQVCSQHWSPVQLIKSNGKWVYIRPRPANVPGEFKMCDKKGKCMRGASCTFAHSREELESWNKDREGPPMPDKPRPAPIISGNRYMMCTHHSNGKRCLYGADCKFAHSLEELDSWNSSIIARSGDGSNSNSRTNSTSVDNEKHVTSPVRSAEEHVKQRIIPGLPTKTSNTNNRTRLSSLSSNNSNNSDYIVASAKSLPVSLTLNHNTKEPPTCYVFRCDTCDCTCTSMKQLQEHKAGAKHKQVTRCNSLPDEPVIRSRPSLNSRGIQYSICKSVEESGRCRFGTGCPEAHSYEELEAWNRQLNDSIQALIPSLDNVLPFLEKIRRELDSTDLTIHDLLQPKHGVTIEEMSGSRLDVNHTSTSPLSWTFRVTVKENCQLLGMIMLGEQYPQFTFTCLTIASSTVYPSSTPYSIEFKQALYPGDSFTVQVEFKHQIGCFPQVVVFKFNSFFVGTLLKITCMSEDSFELQNQHRHTSTTQSAGSSPANWDNVVQVIKLEGSELNERDQCPEEYPLIVENIKTSTLSSSLTMLNYQQQLHTLLYLEEWDRQKLLADSHLPNMTCEVTPGYKDDYMFQCAPPGFQYITFALDDLSNSSLHLIGRNKVCEVKAANSNIAYQGILELFGRETLVVRVKDECALLCVNDKASVRFTQKRKLFKYMHYALDRVDLNMLYPDYGPDRSAKPEELISLLNKTNLNASQKSVIEDIVDPYTSHIPTLVCGPFGTGKTSTLVEAVSVLLQISSLSRILVCTHSNSAADIYIERLDKKFGADFLKGKVLRHYYYMRKATAIKPLIMKYTYCVPNHLGSNKFELPPLAQLKELSVIVTTIEQAGDLAFLPNLDPGHFTHIFIDEAAQVMEAQALIPLQLAVRKQLNSTKIVLAGDHMQMEEILVSKQAISFGLHRSILERLMSCPLYATAEGRTSCTQLIQNYRTHPHILRLPSELFYDNSLIAMAKPGSASGALPREPLAFYGVQGQESKDKLSFSYENFVEAREVEERVKALREQGLEESEICVLTPYTKQCQIIRFLLRKIQLGKVNVDTTQGVQGREYRALIVSTVRTCRSEDSGEDEESSFINNPKLFNMAITRAKDWLIVVGDPYTLCTVGPNRSCWEKLVRYCIEYESFHFPNIPEFMSVLSRPILSKFPAISETLPPRDEPLSDYTETQRKQFFRQKLLPIVQQMCPQYAIKVTSVLVEMNTQKMIELFASGNNELQEKVKSTLQFLGIEESPDSSIPRYLTGQMEMLNDHENLINGCIPRLQQTQNRPAMQILSNQMFLLREQRKMLNQQYHLLQSFNATVAPRPHLNGARTNGVLPPASMACTGPGFGPTGGPLYPNDTFLSNNSILDQSSSILQQPAPMRSTSPSPIFHQPNSFIRSSGPPPGWPPYNTPPPQASSFGGANSSAFTVINPINNNSGSSPLHETVSNNVIGAPIYSSNANETAAGSPTTVRNLGPIGEKHF